MKVNYTLLLVAILIGIFLLVFSFSLQKFGLPDDEDIVKIYYVDNISTAHQKIIDNFNDLNSGEIEVVPIDIPFYKFSTNERKELLIRALRSKSERVDVFAADIIWVSRFARWAENLDKYFSEAEKAELTMHAKSTGYVNNSFLSSPLYLDVGVMFYRKDLLSKIDNKNQIEMKLNNSITWSEFISLADHFENKRHYYTFPADAYEGLICSFTELLLTHDKNYFASDIIFNNPEGSKALQLLVDLVNKYKISPTTVTNYREKDAYDNFITNDGLFVRGWVSFENDTKNLNKNSDKEQFIGQTQLPHFKDSEPGATIGGWNLMLAQNSKHKEEAIKFIKYTLSEEAQKILFADGAYLPVIKSIYNDSTFCKENPSIVFSKEILNKGKLRPKLEDYTQISDILSDYIRLAINNEISVDEALLAAETEIKKVRKNR
ncbi:MAG: extracellular solute-binding protein [Ignavibacteriae bacterium]|nr:extracellular solute-binding protein [Ignavibacteriota bacterium]